MSKFKEDVCDLIERNKRKIELHKREYERWKELRPEWAKLDKQLIKFLKNQNRLLTKMLKENV